MNKITFHSEDELQIDGWEEYFEALLKYYSAQVNYPTLEICENENSPKIKTLYYDF